MVYPFEKLIQTKEIISASQIVIALNSIAEFAEKLINYVHLIKSFDSTYDQNLSAVETVYPFERCIQTKEIISGSR